MRFLLPWIILFALSAVASATTDVAGPFGSNSSFFGFSGRFPLVGRIGAGGGGGGGCAGVIDASAGCPLPMLGVS